VPRIRWTRICKHGLVRRRMRDPAFRSVQLADVMAKRRMSHPRTEGVDARLLSVLRDPGPKTKADHRGSGFPC
jgi:hypothetical protein